MKLMPKSERKALPTVPRMAGNSPTPVMLSTIMKIMRIVINNNKSNQLMMVMLRKV